MRLLLVALILALLPAQAMAAGPSKQQIAFVWTYGGAAGSCGQDGPILRDNYVAWRHGRYGGPALQQMAERLSRDCAFFMNGEDPPLPRPTSPTERKLVKAWADLRYFFIQYAFLVAGETQGFNFYVDNYWKGYAPINTRLIYYEKILTGQK